MRETTDELHPEMIETADEISTRQGIYGEIKRLLIARGIPAEEIAFIHDFPTPAKKVQAFADVNAGRIRVMIASTEKAGTGVNMQQRLYALHHLDTPWRPSDVEQREGRILRQGNVHPEVHLCQYITEGSFDGYMWQTLESKSRFISQIMAGEVTARTAEDVDQLVMTAAQIKAIASGNPLILEKVAVEVELSRLDRLYSVWRANRRRLREQQESLPTDVERIARTIESHQRAIATWDEAVQNSDEFQMNLKKNFSSEEVITFRDRTRAAAHLREQILLLARAASGRGTQILGSYRGFEIIVSGRQNDRSLFALTETALRVSAGEPAYHFNLGESDIGMIQSMDAQLRGLDAKLEQARHTERELKHRLTQITTELSKGWEQAERFQELKEKLATLNAQFTHAGHKVEASPELLTLEADALLPAESIKVLQIVSMNTAPTTDVVQPTAVVAEQMIPDFAVEETVLPPPSMQESADDLLPALTTLAELRRIDTQQRKPLKRRPANSQQMNFGWL